MEENSNVILMILQTNRFRWLCGEYYVTSQNFVSFRMYKNNTP